MLRKTLPISCMYLCAGFVTIDCSDVSVLIFPVIYLLTIVLFKKKNYD